MTGSPDDGPVTTSTRTEWLIPTGLITLSAVPVLVGALRVGQLAGVPVGIDANPTFAAFPVPVIVHIVGATVYCLLGALQFAPGFRRRRPGWHRAAGRLLIPFGLAAALAGIWMTVFQSPNGPLQAGFRLGFGTAMVVAILLGLAAVRRRDIVAHRAWMTRGYAIGLGAGTQFVLLATWSLAVGSPDELTETLLLAAGWMVNLAVAEWSVRRSLGARRPVPAPTLGR